MPRTNTRASGEAGFTLIELMVAMVVLSVGLVSMAQLLAFSTVMHSDARQATSVTPTQPRPRSRSS